MNKLEMKVKWYAFKVNRIERKRQSLAGKEVASKAKRKRLGASKAMYMELLRVEFDRLQAQIKKGKDSNGSI